MEILVLDDDIYLGMTVTTRLLEDGHHCDNHICASEVNFSKHYDAILLSTNLENDSCNKIIKHYENSTIILLVTYVSDATVTKPIKAGADDYVLKPFSMDELIRKIHHFDKFKNTQRDLLQYKEYFDFLFKEIENEDMDLKNIKLPIIIETNNQKYVDKLVFDMSNEKDKRLKFISMSNMVVQGVMDELSLNKNFIYVLTNFHSLKKSFKQLLMDMIPRNDILIVSLEKEDEFYQECKENQIEIDKIEIKDSNQSVVNDKILTINDYVKLVVTSFQHKYPDTELSKKLGISRKSLWEKRKKLNIEKKK
eukprot:Anaeramoba_flamelloidesa89145_26.p1 GENE.a89145_26~~a89145_26.p1  ORF type:complete len:308 (+),score=12.04 a89145_26:564-1487(+)